MARQQSPAQKETVSRVMHEFKHGELRIRGNGPKVKNSKQALAIALHEAGTTNQETAKTNRKNLQKTKTKERKGETAQASKEGKNAQDRTMKPATARKGGDDSKSKSALYAEAKRRDVPGRSKMSKGELERALAG
jgi:hypothetical protein